MIIWFKDQGYSRLKRMVWNEMSSTAYTSEMLFAQESEEDKRRLSQEDPKGIFSNPQDDFPSFQTSSTHRF